MWYKLCSVLKWYFFHPGHIPVQIRFWNLHKITSYCLSCIVKGNLRQMSFLHIIFPLMSLPFLSCCARVSTKSVNIMTLWTVMEKILLHGYKQHNKLTSKWHFISKQQNVCSPPKPQTHKQTDLMFQQMLDKGALLETLNVCLDSELDLLLLVDVVVCSIPTLKWCYILCYTSKITLTSWTWF